MKRGRLLWAVGGTVAAAVVVVAAIVTINWSTGSSRPSEPRGRVSWTSGVFPGNGINTAAATQFGSYRGCPTRIASVFTGAQNWAQLADQDWYLAAYRGYSGRLSIAVPLTFRGTSLAAVSQGAGDAAFAAFARHLIEFGRGDSDLRLGWEFNGDWEAWSAYDASTFDGAFRRAAGLLKQLLPSATIDWNGNLGPSQSGHNPFSQLYPGNDVVDVIGLDAYDNGSAHAGTTAGFATWARSPFGLDQWYAFARAHGKKFAVPEWGLSADGGGDNATYIRQMYQWFADHASGLSYESYFNYPKSNIKNSLTDPVQMPAASAAYASLWHGGPAC